MKLKTFKSFINIFIVIIPMIITASPAAENFTADITKKEGDKQTKGKVYVKGYKYRIDIATQEEEISILVNTKTDKRYIINHLEKTARDIQNSVFESLYINPLESAIGYTNRYDSAEVSLDTIDGYECKKNEIYEQEKKLMTIWTTDKLSWPIKVKREHNPSIETELKNIKEESFDNSFFMIPEGYEISSSFATEEKIEEPKRIEKKLPTLKVKQQKPVDTASMKKVIFAKLEQNNIKRETKEGKIKLEPVEEPILEKFFPDWKIFRITREKQIQEENLFRYIPVEKAAVNKDDETVCIISSPATDMPLKSALTIIKSENIILRNAEESKDFAKALDALYFRESKVQGVDSMGNNKWSIYTGTFFEYLTGFLVKADSTGKVIDIKYSLKIKKK